MSEKILEILVFVLGGSAYGLMEILFRGHTHWTMVITGGACILTLYLLSGWLMSIPLILAAASGALIVTAYESVSYTHLDVYKRQPTALSTVSNSTFTSSSNKNELYETPRGTE